MPESRSHEPNSVELVWLSAGVTSANDDARDMSDMDDVWWSTGARVGECWSGFKLGRAGDGVWSTICGRPRGGEEGGVGG